MTQTRKQLVLAVVAAGVLAGGLATAHSLRRVRIEDRCEPASFNQEVGPGTCVGKGRITFQEFIDELTEKQEVGSWEFNNDEVKVRSGEPIELRNVGGELHTVTKVAEFGGGFDPLLNELSGVPTPRPECVQLGEGGVPGPAPESESNEFLFTGETTTLQTGPGTLLAPGTHIFQCCVHPWMRLKVEVR